jgi:hypothetical protein
MGSKRNQTHNVLVLMAQYLQENIYSNRKILNIPPMHDIGYILKTNHESHPSIMKQNRIAEAYNYVTLLHCNLNRKFLQDMDCN